MLAYVHNCNRRICCKSHIRPCLPNNTQFASRVINKNGQYRCHLYCLLGGVINPFICTMLILLFDMIAVALLSLSQYRTVLHCSMFLLLASGCYHWFQCLHNGYDTSIWPISDFLITALIITNMANNYKCMLVWI